eukprot:TRINITY_DN67758_c0_g1_i1.p1 TRINITY_DN67758_c0_g1~~TRINITY_DN67758_c0_g1_i1.p1  ORF type:complete len:408 (-),score=121.14 TRINITY_DN67758_c0_g1_i1:44-1204(-)
MAGHMRQGEPAHLVLVSARSWSLYFRVVLLTVASCLLAASADGIANDAAAGSVAQGVAEAPRGETEHVDEEGIADASEGENVEVDGSNEQEKDGDDEEDEDEYDEDEDDGEDEDEEVDDQVDEDEDENENDDEEGDENENGVDEGESGEGEDLLQKDVGEEEQVRPHRDLPCCKKRKQHTSRQGKRRDGRERKNARRETDEDVNGKLEKVVRNMKFEDEDGELDEEMGNGNVNAMKKAFFGHEPEGHWVNLNQARVLMHSFGVPEHYANVIDTNNDKKISYGEFLTFVDDKFDDDEDVTLHALDAHDRDDSGALEEHEAEEAIKHGKIFRRTKDWRPFDKDRDGTLSFEEITEMAKADRPEEEEEDDPDHVDGMPDDPGVTLRLPQ